MLVLQRKIGEAICVGDDIKITVVQIRRHACRLAIEAPAEVRILRGELLDDSEGEA